MKKSFSLFITIILVSLFSYLSLSILETKNISSNIDTLKYLHLQAQIHLEYIKNYIKIHSQNEIESFILNDNRFYTNIIKQNENNQTIYNITIKAKEKNIRLNYSFR